MIDADADQLIREKYEKLAPHLDERQVRLWAGAEATSLGWGGVSAVARATGLSRTTVALGVEEIASAPIPAKGRKAAVRQPGGGRKRLTETQPGLEAALDKLIDPVTRGDPESPLRWSTKSAAHLAGVLQEMGFKVSADTVRRLLHYQGYSLQKTQKTLEGSTHPDRDGQFEYINAETRRFQAAGQPVVSVDTKKKELVGDFANGGQEWQRFGQPTHVNVHDFPSQATGKAIPYGVYDVSANDGWVSVGIDHDTAEFATETIGRWWSEMGSQAYPDARELLITADCGGSNSPRTRLWFASLQQVANRTGLRISVCHFPPGTSKWNKIEHRLFAQISLNWRGRPLTSFETVVNLIAATSTKTGLKVRAALDATDYPKGKVVPESVMENLRIARADYHGEWNYSIEPEERS